MSGPAQHLICLALTPGQVALMAAKLRHGGFSNDTVSVLLTDSAIQALEREERGATEPAGSERWAEELLGLPAGTTMRRQGDLLIVGHLARQRSIDEMPTLERALTRLGLSKERTQQYATQMQAGRPLFVLSHEQRGELKRAERILHGVGVTEIQRTGGTRMGIFGGAEPTDARQGGEQKGQTVWSLRGIFTLLKQTYQKWSEDKAPRLGAALAYYTVFSLAPLLVVVIALAGLVFGQKAAEGQIVGQLGGLVGEQSAQAIQGMIANAWKPKSGIVATILGTATLLLGASGVFGQLQDALNTVWGVKPKPNLGIWGMLRQRFASLTTLLGTAFLLMVSLVLSAALAAVGTAFHHWLPVPEAVLQALEFLISFGVITLLFAMMFKLLPDIKMSWGDVWLGAVVTALLFTIGKFALGLYLGKSDIGSSFGAAGSLVILLVWIYYSGQILLFGAEFTAVYANSSGSRIVPSEIAEPVSEQSPAA